MLEETRVKVSCDKHMTRFQLVPNDNTVVRGGRVCRSRGWSEQFLVGSVVGHARVVRAPVRQPWLVSRSSGFSFHGGVEASPHSQASTFATFLYKRYTRESKDAHFLSCICGTTLETKKRIFFQKSHFHSPGYCPLISVHRDIHK